MLKFQNEKETKNASVLGINIYEEKTGKMYLNLIGHKDTVDAYVYVAYSRIIYIY